MTQNAMGPRTLVCLCNEPPGADGHWNEHEAHCPVRRMRLRKHPMGATWLPEAQRCCGTVIERGCWLVNDVVVWRADVVSNFAVMEPECAAMLREAFCEPLVRVSFDLGGVLTRAPHVVGALMRALAADPGVDLFVLTDMARTSAREILERVGLSSAIDEKHLVIADWGEHDEMCKVEARRALGIDLHVDDLPAYAQHTKLPDGRPGLGLLLMPSALPYDAAK